MFKIVVNPEITFTVDLPKNSTGEIPSIEMTCKVFPDEELENLTNIERFQKIVVSIDGLVDEKGKKLKYTSDLIPILLRQGGFQGAFHTAFSRAVVWGAEKNFVGLPN